ncbi:MAG TPA: heat-inducible transcriptional repressor HrcA [Polyangiaceae bacterium]|nr:heat-inducible transcriptional repressor HrcA [Polyangiaceae bacterium]
MSGLTGRGRKILFAVVTEYIGTGHPVGSRTLSRKYGIDLSAATIRNVLADLEDAGYLKQPHTSAGRIPTELALRAFILALTDFAVIPRQQKQTMRERFDEIFSERGVGNTGLREAGQFISELTGAAAIVAASPAETRKLSQFRFIRTKPNQLLAVLVFSDGTVENRYVGVEEPLNDADLERIHNLLADVVEGRTLAALRELFERRLAHDRLEVDALRRQAFDLGQKAIQDLARGSDEVVIEGSARLMELPEYADVDRLKKLVLALEDREYLLGLLDKTIDAGTITVYLGNETPELGEADLSLVAAPYGDQGGTVGVLGPTRMDYARMMPLVDATAAAITAALKKGSS